jgi:ribosome-associated protein
MNKETLRPELRLAIEAAQNKKAGAITVLDLKGLGAFTEAFLLCTGYSTPQLQAIADAIEEALQPLGLRPLHREGRSGSEWLLLDYGGFLVHIFSEELRRFYDLERLWRMARRIDFSDDDSLSNAPGDISAAGGSTP